MSVTSRALSCDLDTWRTILLFLPRSALRRVAKTNRALRATVDSIVFRCDIVDRFFFVPAQCATDCFACLQSMRPWAIKISSYMTAGAEEDVARTVEKCHVVAIAVAVNCISKYFEALAKTALVASANVTLDQLAQFVAIRSGTVEAEAKAVLSDRLLSTEINEFGDFLLALGFAVIQSSLSALGSAGDATFERERALFDSADAPLLPMLDKALRFCDAASFSKEKILLLASLPHTPRLLQLLERFIVVQATARTTCLINYDEVHDLNENVQTLCTSSWFERTVKVLKSRGKGNKWLSSTTATDAASNPSALAAHMAWCRRISSKLTAWTTCLPAIAIFADYADHRQAPQFLQSLTSVSRTRLTEALRPPRSGSPVVLDDFPRYVTEPRAATPEGFTVRTALRLAELDAEFAAQLVTFDYF